MSRALFLGTLLFAGPFLSMSWAQNKTEPTQTGPPSRLQKRHFSGIIPARAAHHPACGSAPGGSMG